MKQQKQTEHDCDQGGKNKTRADQKYNTHHPELGNENFVDFVNNVNRFVNFVNRKIPLRVEFRLVRNCVEFSEFHSVDIQESLQICPHRDR